MTRGKLDSRFENFKVDLWEEIRGGFIKSVFSGGAVCILAKKLTEATNSVFIRTNQFVVEGEKTLVSALAKIPEGNQKNTVLSNMFIFSFDNEELPSLPECLQYGPIVKSFQDTDSFWEQDFLPHIANLNVERNVQGGPMPAANHPVPNNQENVEEMADDEGETDSDEVY